ncbi:MAG: hypothetical protein ABI823_15195 [Bryobacteraceae bacterium]
MRVPINLASEPFRRDRPILVATIAMGGVLTALLALQTFLVFSERARMSETRDAIEVLNKEVMRFNTEQAKIDGAMRQPENAEVLQRSLLLNTLINRKSISWTRMFADIGQVMPADVRLITVRLPNINSRNEVLLDMVVGAKSPEPVIQFIRRLEGAPMFGPTTIHTQLPPGQNDPLYRARISVSYAQKL